MDRKRSKADQCPGPGTNEPECCLPMRNTYCASETDLMDVCCKTAVVVGGASDVGYETCAALLDAGAKKVCVVDYQQKRTIAVVDKLNAGSSDQVAHAIMADIRSDCAFDLAFREAMQCLSQIDIYVNCICTYNETPECWDQMVKLNLIGSIRGTILAHHYMSLDTGEECPQGGVILNMSSFGAIANIPSMPLYSAVCNGINGLTSSFGQDFHYDCSKIRCITLCSASTAPGMLKNMEKLHYRREWASHSYTALKSKAKQTAKDVGRAIVHTIKCGHNGNVYVLTGGKYYRYLMPDYRKIMRREAYLV